MVLFLGIIMASLYISGIMMSQMMKQSYEDENESQMVVMAEDAAAWVKAFYAGAYTVKELEIRLNAKAESNQDSIWVVNSSGTYTQYGERLTDGDLDDQVINLYFNSMIDILSEGHRAKVIVPESSPFNTQVMVVAVPFENLNGQNDYIFVQRKVDNLNTQLMNIYRQIVLSIAISAVMAIALTYGFTRSMLRPLSVVTKGAKQLSRGHFDIWLEVRSKDEIGQLADTFNSMAQDLMKYESTRNSFVANVSHELRSPLTSMQGLLQGVLDGTIPENETQHYVEIVLDETKRLNTLINNMLDLSKMESGEFPLQLEEIEVNELIRRILITFETKIDVKNLMVEVEFTHDNEYASADRSQLMQVVQNIMDNAIKFADYGGRLRISTLSSADKVFISINNSGEPIPRSMLPYLFDRFYKGDKSHTRVKDGAGIGLSLVKKILEEHRQKIWVESDSMSGTTFTFTLNKIVK